MKRLFLLPFLIGLAFAQSPTPGSRTVLNNPKVQTDIDMSNHRLLNLDISNISFTPTFTPIFTANNLGQAADDTKGVLLQNTTPATLNLQQWSPEVQWTGYGWSINSNASRIVQFRSYVVTNASGNFPTGYLTFEGRSGGTGSWTSDLNLFQQGGISVGGTGPPGFGIIDAQNGYRVGGLSPTAGHVLRSNGTNFVDSSLTLSDLSSRNFSDLQNTGIYTPEQYGAGATQSTADNTPLQNMVAAVNSAGGGKIVLSRRYTATASLAFTTGNVEIVGAGDGTGIVGNFATGDIISFTPTVTPTQVNGLGLKGLSFRNFYLDSSVAKSSGAALHLQYPQAALVDHVTIGTQQPDPNGTAPNIFDGIYAQNQENTIILTPNIFVKRNGVLFTGLGQLNGNPWPFFAYGGYVGGSGKLYGTYTVGSVGIHIAGGNGGVELGDFDCGSWETAVKVDKSIVNVDNRELFVGRCFLDNSGKNGLYVAADSLTLLHLQNAWMAGNGRAASDTAGYPNGAGVYVDPSQTASAAGGFKGIINGARIYANQGSGVSLGYGSWSITGSQIHNNGLGANGGHGIEINGAGDYKVVGNDLQGNGNASAGWGIYNASALALLLIGENDFNVCGQGGVFNPASYTSNVIRGNLFQNDNAIGINTTPNSTTARLIIEQAGNTATAHIRLRDASAPRYRADFAMGSPGAGISINSYDDTGSAATPISLSGSNVTLTSAGNLSLQALSASQYVKTDGSKVLISASGVPSGDITGLATICNGRLTTESGVPVSTSDRIAQSTIYFTPYNGAQVALYSGSVWAIYNFSEISLALSSLTSGKNYDVFVYNNSGAITLELSSAWTNDTTRANAIVLQDGIYVKSGATTRRYLGTIRTTGTTTTEDSGGGSTTQVGGKRFVWNYYNRVRRGLRLIDTTDSWAYGTATIRQADGAASNKVEYVTGDIASTVTARVQEVANLASNSGSEKVGVGIDSITSFSGLVGANYQGSATPSQFNTVGNYNGQPGLGYHYVAWLEKGTDGTCLFLGDDGGVGLQSGLIAEIDN